MKELQNLCYTELEALDTHMRELQRLTETLAIGASEDDDNINGDIFALLGRCVQGLRAELDDIHGALIRIAETHENAITA